MQPLAILVFGSPRLLRDGSPVHGRAVQKKRVGLLLVLAAAAERQATRDRLVGLLWSETDPTQARRVLTEAVYVIRTEVDEDLIRSQGDVLSLDPARLDCDLWRFREAAQRGDHRTVLEIAHAPVLDGFYLDNAPEFERWSDTLRSETDETLERSVRALAHEYEAAKEWRAAAEVWRRATRLDMLRSEFALNLSRALERAGEAAHALAALRQHEQALRVELEVGPETEVIERIERLRKLRPLTPQTAMPAVRPAKSPTSEPEPPAEQHREPAVVPPPAPARRRTRYVFYAAVALVAVLLAGWATRDVTDPRPPVRLAVRYLQNESPRPELDAIADELTHALIAQVADNEAFDVIPASGSRRFRDPSLPVDSLARALGATHVVEGRLNVMGEVVVGIVRLLDATGRQIGEKSFERAPTHLVFLRDDLARQVAAMIRTTLGRQVRLNEIRWGSRNSRAFQIVAQANRALNTGRQLLGSLDASARASATRTLLAADSLFVAAQAEDRDWFEPHVGRSRAALLLARADSMNRRAPILDTALLRLETAAPAFPDEAAVHEALAAVRWARVQLVEEKVDSAEVQRAIRELERALVLEPQRARSLTLLARIRFFLNEYALAELTAREALDADAYLEEAPSILRMLFVSTLYLENYSEAERHCNAGHAAYPRDWWFVECRLTLLKYRTDLPPDTVESRRLLALADSLDPPRLARAAGHAYSPLYRRLVHAAIAVRAGDREAGRQALADVRGIARLDRELALDMVPEEVTLLALFGQHAEARALLDAAVKQRPLLGGLAERDPLLRELLRVTTAPR